MSERGMTGSEMQDSKLILTSEGFFASSKLIDASMRLFRQECNFAIGATKLSDIPKQHLPEIAFVGRSNVGKSSLLNALTFRNSLARVSGRPGCTQQFNFFNLGDKLMLVDLPGYGYAEASKQKVAGWTKLILDYLRGRRQLKRVLLLIDGRHGMKPNDLEIMDVLDDSAVSYQVVVTKCDKVKKADIPLLISAIEQLGKKHPALHPHVLLTSSEAKLGVENVRAVILDLIEGN